MKKGFTLVELLAVIAIIGVLTTLIIPSVSRMVRDRKSKLYENQVNELVSVTRQYMANNPEMYDAIDEYGHVYVTLRELCNSKHIDCTVVDPRDNSTMEGLIRVSLSGTDYIYKYYDGVIESSLNVELNGGETTQEFLEYYTDGETIELIEPTKSEYEFLGWEIIEGDAVLVDNSKLIIGTEDSTIYALWRAYPHLVVNLDGGSLSQTFETAYVTGTVINLETPIKVGKAFAGWEILSGNSILSGSTLTLGTQDTEIKATYTDCAAGTYNDGTSSSCMACPAGSYCASGSTSPTQCEGGTYSSAGSVSCSNCPSGTYSGNGAGSCTSCPSGSYSSERSSSCMSCPGGMSGGGTDIANCSVVCGAGTYLKAGEGSCTSCPAGKYCAGGTFSYNTSSDQGINGNCNEGSYSTGGASAATCTACPGSMTSTAGSTAKTACKITCSAGQHLAKSEGACSSCPAGKYCSSSGTYNYSDSGAQGITGNCNENTYSTGGASAATCTACPGSMTSTAGSTAKTSCKITCSAGNHLAKSASACSSCPAGKYCSSSGTYNYSDSAAQGITGNCNENTYSTGGASAATCTACPGSMTSTAGSTAKTSCKITCTAGNHLAKSANACSSCPAGKYCTGGTYNYSDSAAQGITGNCNAGRFSTGGASAATCTACAKGSYSAAGASACTACQPSGAAGTGGTTSGTGATSCNASCGKSNVASWNTATWSSNSVSNSCSIKTCASNYSLSGGNCVATTCTVYCKGSGSCSKTRPSTQNTAFAVFTCNKATGKTTGGMQSCWVYNTYAISGGYLQCDSTGRSWHWMCTSGNTANCYNWGGLQTCCTNKSGHCGDVQSGTMSTSGTYNCSC